VIGNAYLKTKARYNAIEASESGEYIIVQPDINGVTEFKYSASFEVVNVPKTGIAYRNRDGLYIAYLNNFPLGPSCEDFEPGTPDVITAGCKSRAQLEGS